MRLKEGNTCVIRIETGSRSHGGTRNIMVYHPLSSSLIGRVREAHRNFCWQSLRISVSSTERPHWSGCLREASVNNWQDDWQQAFYRVTFTSIRRIRPDSDISQKPYGLGYSFWALLDSFPLRCAWTPMHQRKGYKSILCAELSPLVHYGIKTACPAPFCPAPFCPAVPPESWTSLESPPATSIMAI
ncbi:hypothetical protein IG631_04601 [Alternaria alternata]|nr:hypothetical protein IG631_04601 [Alternaria alternata]